MSLKRILISLPILALLPLWFTDAQSAVAVSGHNHLGGGIPEACRWSLPSQQFLMLPDAAKIELIGDCPVGIIIHGVITGDDGRDFVKLVGWFAEESKRKGRGSPPVRLNSEGGSVVAAVMMAKAIRTSAPMHDNGFTNVLESDKCYSACVIVLAGSYRRSVFGRVGIHRPYFVGDEFTRMGYKDLQQAYGGLHEELSALFKQWNLSALLVDDMFAVPSTGVRMLTDEELSAYGLNKEDWVLSEEYNANVRAACGEEAAAQGSVDAGFAAMTWWASPTGQECQRKLDALLKARSIAKVKKLCGNAEAQAAEHGRSVSEECAEKFSAAD